MLAFSSGMVLILVVNGFSVDMELLREQLGFVLSSVFVTAIHRG